MALKIQARTKVGPDFIDAMIGVYSDWMTLNMQIIRSQSNSGKRMGMTARRMLPIVRRQSPGARDGLDYELTRLRGLPYVEFATIMGTNPQTRMGQTLWLVGRTKHVTMTEWNHRNTIMGEMGKYDVFIPSTIVRHPNMAHIHMIPVRNPNSTKRHPHHYLQTDSVTGDPLALMTGNCWGSYSGVLKGLIDEPDVPELFRQLYNHLCTYGDRPPVHMASLDFDWSTKE